jgi:hypothetical protein
LQKEPYDQPFSFVWSFPSFGVRKLTGDLAETKVGRFAARARQHLEGDHVLGQDIHLPGNALAYSQEFHRKRDGGSCLNQQPAVRIIVRPLLPIALVTPELDNFADTSKGQVERRLPKLLHELPGVRFIVRGGC